METLLGLAYRAFHHGRTPEQNTQQCKESMYAEQKARVIKQRPSPLPATRQELSQTSLLGHHQPSCPLFTTLPPELRQRIYVYVLGGSIVHFTHDPERRRLKARRLNLTEHQINDEEPPTGTIPLQIPSDTESQPAEAQHEPSPIARPPFSALPLLQTCRAIYAEATPILYSSNTFSMSSPLELIYMKDYTLLPQRIAQIRHLQLVPWVYFDNPEHHIRNISEPYDKETWPRFWDIVAGMDLVSLGLWVEYWGKKQACSLEAEWIQPLLKVRGVKNVGIQLQLRASAWDTRRLQDLEKGIERVWTSKS